MTRSFEVVLKNTAQRVDILVVDSAGAAVDASDGPHLQVLNDCDTVIYRDSYSGTGNFTLTGTVSVSAGATAVTGTNTKFTVEVTVGEDITINGETIAVQAVNSDTSLTLSANHVAGASSVSATRPTRIIKPGSTTGQYYILWGDPASAWNLPDQSETDRTGDLNFHWRATGTASTEEINVIQVVKVVSACVMRMLPYLRTMIDKAALMVDDDPSDPCYLGYTDGQLIQYLEQGLHNINTYEPYPIWCTLESYPFNLFGHLLLESALIAGVMSQQLFAIATDVPNFSDQGNTFVIQHAPQLASFLNQITTRLDKQIPMMKLKFVNSGSLHVEAGANYRMAQLLSASPSGALFRNVYFRG